MRNAFTYRSPLGSICLTADAAGLTGLWFSRAAGGPPLSRPVREACAPQAVLEAGRWLDVYFSGREPAFTPRLHVTGTDFRLLVWRLLLQIPYGKTVTYGELARRIGPLRSAGRMAPQAVGGAVGHNAIAIIIPCHRVVGHNGNLTGYAAGIDKKIRLLQLEGVSVQAVPV